MLCDWFSLGANKWNCKGVPYLVKNTEDCRNFKEAKQDCQRQSCFYWRTSSGNNCILREDVKDKKCPYRKMVVGTEDVVKPETTNPLQHMELE